MAEEDVSALVKEKESLQAKLKEVNAESAARRKEIQEMKSSMEELKSKYGEIDVDKYSELMSKEKKLEETKLHESGKFEELAAKKEQEFKSRFDKQELAHSKALEEREKQMSEVMQRLEHMQIDSVIASVAHTSGAIQPDQVVKLTRDAFTLTEAGDVKILGDDGDVARDDQGTPHTPESFVKAWLAENPHQVKATPGGSGTKLKSASNHNPDTSVGLIAQGLKKRGIA